MTNTMQYGNSRKGFTLLELSIVLVIIGLLAGGVLVGKELIDAAKIRATVSQYEKMNTALNTFRSKYNSMPGDMKRSDAVAFGMCPAAGCPAANGTGLGDGNGVINDTNATNQSAQVGEPLAMWLQLSRAQLIAENLGNALTNGYAIDVIADAKPASYFPEAKLGKGNYWIAGSGGDNQNYFMLMGVTGLSTGVATAYSLSPADSYGLDSKIDDGKPNTGIVQARQLTVAPVTMMSDLATGNAAIFNTAPNTGNCTTTSNPFLLDALNQSNVYAMYSGAAAEGACVLRMRMMN